MPSAANLVVGNDVKIGGTRVGTVSSITPQTEKDGTVIAVLGLKLD
jgi:ABC-type transporter Mla subunit MlaD